MSAICGVVYDITASPDLWAVGKMLDAMSHRGPDGRNILLSENAALGHRALKTTPESLHEILPWRDDESGFSITADARIDNREELGRSLGIVREVQRDLPDSRIILLAYQRWGERCVDYLIGDFAFAIWSERERKLFCARDHLGIRPFNYYCDGAMLVFASESQAITLFPGVPRVVNEGRLADALVPQLEGIDKTSTFYRDIYRLAPAHSLTFIDGRLSTRCYWQPGIEKQIELESDDDYVEAFSAIYRNAIDARMRSNGDVGLLLSGGIDSASIAAFANDSAQRNGTDGIRAFSATDPGNSRCEETRFINLLDPQGGLDLHSLPVDALADINDDICRIVDQAQEPFDPMIMIIALYLRAGKSGCRTMLDGIDGDVVASLPASYPVNLLKTHQYHAALSAMFFQAPRYYAGRLSRFRVIWQTLRAAYTPSSVRRLYRLMRPRDPANELRESLISAEFAQRVDIEGRLARLSGYGNLTIPDSLRQRHRAAILHPYLTVAVERYDRIAALCGIEPRHPLLDKRVVEFMLAIPSQQKVRSGWSKYLLRRASEPLLPQALCWRQGWEHLGWSFAERWLNLNLSDICDKLRKYSDVDDGYVDMTRFTALIERCGKNAHGSANDACALLSMFYLWSWMNQRKGCNDETR